MYLLLGALKNWWLSFYNDCVKNLDDKTKVSVGIGCIVISIALFILSTKGNDKSGMINSWFFFWLSLFFCIVGLFYLTYA